MKKYELNFDENKGIIQRISVVDTPAVGTGMVLFSENKEAKTTFFGSDEQQVFYSIAMRPNTLIFRSNVSSILGKVEPAEVFYTSETVAKVHQMFWKNNANKEVNLNHNFKTEEGIYPFASWQVIDENNDTATAMGLDVRKGDLVIGYKVENPEIWQKVKDKELTGLSIECLFEFNEVVTDFNNQNNFKNEKKMVVEKTPQSLWDNLKAFFSDEKPVVENLDPDLEKPLVKEEMAVDPATETQADEVKEDVDVEALTAENVALKAQVLELQTALSKADKTVADAQNDMTKMAKEILEFSKQAGENQVEKPYDQMTNVEKMRYNRSK